MNIIYGLYHADEGQILVDGTPVSFDGPGDAIAAGIGMVHQHFMLVPVFTVAENVTLGVEPSRTLGQLDRRRAAEDVQRLSEQFGLPVDPTAVVEQLPVGVQQRVEILKALYRDARLLILDEPTAVLTPPEIEDLFTAVRGLARTGRSVIFISHKLREHRTLVDRISVLRSGRIVGIADPRTVDDANLAEMMVGRPVDLVVNRPAATTGDVVLSVKGLTVRDDRGAPIVDGVAFDVRAGEVVGIAGVEGNGQTELVRALTGLAKETTEGSITIRGREILGRTRKDVLRGGVGHVPEDRTHEGLIGAFSVAENLVLNMWDAEPFAHGARLQFGRIAEHASQLVADYDIRTPSIHTAASALSGGNQQKVVVAREFDRPIDLLVAAQPTRGVDVGAIEYIHRRIIEKRDDGAAVLIVSSELDEVLALADRVAVMFRGGLSGPFDTPIDKERVGLMMAGGDPNGMPAGDAV
jgi:simple sugar transport system ATP-binding protein